MSWNEVGAKGFGDEKKTAYVKMEGTVKLRVMDAEPSTYWTHWIPQINAGKGGSVDCLGKGCPVCKIIAEDKKNGMPKKYSSTKKHMLNVINRATNTIEILNAGETVFDGLKQIMTQMGDLRNMDVSITRTGAAKQTKYAVLPVYPPTPLTADERAMDLYVLEEAHKPLTGEQVIMLLGGKSYKEIFANNVSEDGDEGVPDFTAE